MVVHQLVDPGFVDRAEWESARGILECSDPFDKVWMLVEVSGIYTLTWDNIYDKGNLICMSHRDDF